MVRVESAQLDFHSRVVYVSTRTSDHPVRISRSNIPNALATVRMPHEKDFGLCSQTPLLPLLTTRKDVAKRVHCAPCLLCTGTMPIQALHLRRNSIADVANERQLTHSVRPTGAMIQLCCWRGNTLIQKRLPLNSSTPAPSVIGPFGHATKKFLTMLRDSRNASIGGRGTSCGSFGGTTRNAVGMEPP